jgi:hypothetical protein
VWLAIDRSAGPWLIVGEVDGGVPSDEIASVDRVSVGEALLADRQKVSFV